MINSVVISGRYEGLNDNNKLLLRIDRSPNRQVIQIFIGETIKKQLLNFVHKNDIIGIKGYIDLDESNNMLIIATKITLLSGYNKSS